MCDGGAQTKGGVGVSGVFSCTVCSHTHTHGCAIIWTCLQVAVFLLQVFMQFGLVSRESY